MARVLTDQMLDAIGARQVDRTCREVSAELGSGHQFRLEGAVAGRLCEDTVRQFFHLLASDIPMPSAAAALVMGSMRLGWALAYDQIEQDVALVNAVTGDGGE